jgi:hypothetical protein
VMPACIRSLGLNLVSAHHPGAARMFDMTRPMLRSLLGSAPERAECRIACACETAVAAEGARVMRCAQCVPRHDAGVSGDGLIAFAVRPYSSLPVPSGLFYWLRLGQSG